MSVSYPIEFEGIRPPCPRCNDTGAVMVEPYDLARDEWVMAECPACGERHKEGGEA